jgi:hypothetical protein
MDCPKIEERLSEYMESALPQLEMEQIAGHLRECSNCTALLKEMRSTLLECRSFPILEMDPDLTEKILLRTSGRPRTRSFQERFRQYILIPLLTPRFAFGTGLAALFLILLINFMLPRASGVLAALAPGELLKTMDRGMQRLYGEGLRAYDKKNEWQAEINFLKTNIVNKLRFTIEQLDIPVEETQKPQAPEHQKEKAPPKEKSSLLRQLLASGRGNQDSDVLWAYASNARRRGEPL